MTRRSMRKLATYALMLAFGGPTAAEILSTPAGDIFYETRGEGCPLVLIGGGSAMDARQWQGWASC